MTRTELIRRAREIYDELPPDHEHRRQITYVIGRLERGPISDTDDLSAVENRLKQLVRPRRTGSFI